MTSSTKLKRNAKKFNTLGDKYYFGKGVPINYTKAREYYIKYYKKACDMEHANGCSNYGHLHTGRTGDTKNYSIALKYAKKGRRRLKIETSYRKQEINKGDYSLIDTMQIYNEDLLVNSKIELGALRLRLSENINDKIIL